MVPDEQEDGEALTVGSVSLSVDQWEWMRERARREDRSMSSVMRRCVREAMEKEG